MNKVIVIAIILIAGLAGCLKEKTPPSAEPLVELAKQDLAFRLNISESNITVIKVIPVEWPDASLGYPEEGKLYAQVITPGYKIILLANKKEYEYHSDYKRAIAPKNIN